jgi:putative transposase
MVTPGQRRIVAAWAQSAFQLSERRACGVLAASRSSLRYCHRRPDQEPLRRRLRELAAGRVHAGYRQLHVYLRREGWAINHKRTYRLYCEEELSLRRRRPKRRRSAVPRQSRPQPTRANEVWAIDFMHDTLADGRLVRVLTGIDVYTRECVALAAAKAFHGEEVARLLAEAGTQRGALPRTVRVDNGTEFTSKALDAWAYWNGVQLDFSRPGKPSDNAFIEAFNATLRRECLSQHWFRDLEEAQQLLVVWRLEYNNVRPHSSLGRETPARYRAGALNHQDRNRAEKSPI